MKTLLSLSLILLAVMTANAQSADEKDVAAAVEKLRKAMIAADRSELAAIAAEELSYGHSNGKIEDKAAFVEAIASHANVFKTIEQSEQTIKLAGTTAIVRFHFKAETANNGTPGSANLSVLTIWQKQKGTWKLLARQAVKI